MNFKEYIFMFYCKKDEFFSNGLVNELTEKQLLDVCAGNSGCVELECDWDELSSLSQLFCFKEKALKKFEESFPDERDRKGKILFSFECDGEDIKDVDVKISLVVNRNDI